MKHPARAIWIVLLTVIACYQSALAQPAPATTELLKSEAQSLRTFVAQSYLDDLERVDRLAFRLIQAASPYCVKSRRYSFGATPRRLADMPANLQAALAPFFEPRPELYRFLSIPTGSPLAENGQISVKDRIIGLREWNLDQTIQPGWVMQRAVQTTAVNDPLRVSVLREATSFEVAVRPHMLCPQQVVLFQQTGLLARTSKNRLELSTDTLRFIASDDVLAWLLATGLAREILPETGGSTPLEADYLAAYIVAHAGYDLRKGQRFWQYLASNSGAEELRSLMPEHLVTTERLVNLRNTMAEISRKQQTGQAIAPALKRGVAAPFVATTSGQSSPPAEPIRAPTPEEQALADTTRIPFLRSGGIVGYQRFLSSPIRPRAFALSQSGAWSYKSGVSAAADALAHCEVLARGNPCYLYAIDDRVVWNTETASQPPQNRPADIPLQNLPVPPASGFARIDDLNAVPLASADLSAYKAFLEKPSPRAFVITSSGNARYWLGSSSLEFALTWCERLEEACWLYAVNDSVVWSSNPTRRISARKQLNAPSATESSFF